MLSLLYLVLIGFPLASVVPAPQEPVALVLTGLELDLRPDYTTGRLAGTARLTFRNRGTTPVSQVPLLLNRLMHVTRATGSAGLGNWTQGVVIFTDDSLLQVNAITLTLARPVSSGDSVTVSLDYSGRLVGYSETGSLYIRDGVDSAFTIVREDAFAFPVLGRPSWRINRAIMRQPFRFAATVSVPAGQVVAMGGEEVASRSEGDGVITTWQSREPVPFLNIVIAPYQVLRLGGLRIYHFPADSAGAAMIAEAVTRAQELLARWYGPLGGEPRVTIMEIPEGWGSQASLAAGIIQTADAFRARSELRQLYHELSHLWNAPDRDIPSPRWNEGLATFLQWRLAAQLDGWDDWPARLERTRRLLLDRCGASRRCGSVPPAEFGREQMTEFSYQTGFVLFFALHHTLGPERFDSTYRALLEHYRGGVTTAALAAAFEAAEPRARVIFDEWMWSPRWLARLQSESIPRIVDSYRRR